MPTKYIVGCLVIPNLVTGANGFIEACSDVF